MAVDRAQIVVRVGGTGLAGSSIRPLAGAQNPTTRVLPNPRAPPQACAGLAVLDPSRRRTAGAVVEFFK
jgi:hypothetical protein